MELKQDKADDSDNQIDRYDPDAAMIIVKGMAFTYSIFLSNNKIKPWIPQTIEALSADDFVSIVAMQPDVILLGTGTKQIFPPTEALIQCIEANIPVEIMDTAAACRTFNLLVAERRRVVAGLLL